MWLLVHNGIWVNLCWSYFRICKKWLYLIVDGSCNYGVACQYICSNIIGWWHISWTKSGPNARNHYRSGLLRWCYWSIVNYYMIQKSCTRCRSRWKAHVHLDDTLRNIEIQKLLKIKRNSVRTVIKEVMLLYILLPAYLINATACVIPVPTFQFHRRDRNVTCNFFHYHRLQR